MSQQDDSIAALVERLCSEHGCHTVILYGSRARGDAEPDSDYDLAGFSDAATTQRRITGPWRGALLDVFVYPTARLTEAAEDVLHMHGGRVLCERDAVGTAFLAALDRLHAAPPAPLGPDGIEARKNWASKMLTRAARGDAEGNFRRVWMLTELLEHYFLLRGQRFPGSKEALRYLAAADSAAYALFDAALKPNAEHSALEALVSYVTEP